ncbi:MAG: Rid family hydrolase [Pirellulaceae bacterium]
MRDGKHWWVIVIWVLIQADVLNAAATLRRVGVDSENGLSAAVVASNQELLHTSQLSPRDTAGKISPDTGAQIDSLLQNLQQVLEVAGAEKSRIVKLNIYVADTAVTALVKKKMLRWFGAKVLPAVSYVQSPSPDPAARVSLDAVIASPTTYAGVMPATRTVPGLAGQEPLLSVLPRGDVVYVAGQAAEGALPEATAKTLKGLLETLQFMGLDRRHVVRVKCFLKPMSQVKQVNQEIARFFGDGSQPPVSHVQWNSGSRAIEIEMVVYAPLQKETGSISYLTPPGSKASPVFSRIARIHGNQRVYVSGLVARQDGDGEAQVRDIFDSLRGTLADCGSDLRHLAKATYYVSDGDASSQLNAVRPSIYDPARPPAASKAMVAGSGHARRTVTMDIIGTLNPGLHLPTFRVQTRVVKSTSTGDFRTARKMITGPGVNEHPAYPGCTGFVGWESVTRLRSGELICSFSAGYWHVSFPSPVDIVPDLLKRYQQSGFPLQVNAPTGGRALISRSRDNGKSWSQPLTLVDSPGDDRHPVIVETPDGTLVCVFFVIDNWYGYDAPPQGRNKNSRVASIRSTDGGQTWSKPVYMPSPFEYYDRMCGKPVVLKNGDILLSTYGKEHWHAPEQLGVYRSQDGGVSWKFVSRLEGRTGALDEPAITLAQDGTVVMVARPNGEIAFSKDEGRSWTTPRPFGVKMVAPGLMTLKDGTIVCIFGYGGTGGLQIMWSDDHGRTWTVPAADRGFPLDNSVYVYGIGTEMEDGSIYIVYYDPAGKQRKTAIWGLRVKIRADRQGIDLLPMKD